MRVERYSHVMHLVSDVEGELAEGAHPLDALAVTFPAGTVTGAPKRRAGLDRHVRQRHAVLEGERGDAVAVEVHGAVGGAVDAVLDDVEAQEVAAVDGWLVRRLPGLLTQAGLTHVAARAFLPLEREPDSTLADISAAPPNS
jgi:hypothetical protein